MVRACRRRATHRARRARVASHAAVVARALARYGVPGGSSGKFEDVVRKFLSQTIKKIPDLLHHMNTQFSPSLLRAADVPVYQLRQNPGEFIVTFPQAFHAGFSYGFNVGEAVKGKEVARALGCNDFFVARHIRAMEDFLKASYVSSTLIQFNGRPKSVTHWDFVLAVSTYGDGNPHAPHHRRWRRCRSASSSGWSSRGGSTTSTASRRWSSSSCSAR